MYIYGLMNDVYTSVTALWVMAHTTKGANLMIFAKDGYVTLGCTVIVAL